MVRMRTCAGRGANGRRLGAFQRCGGRMNARRALLTGRPPPVFELVEAELGGTPGVAARGEVDVATAPALTRRLDAAIGAGAGAFVVDLCDVEFIDSSGLSVLMWARELLDRDERELAIVCPPGPVRRLFDVAGVADVLTLYPSREAAAVALGG
jgi:anti-sigma B factor antagonist